MRSVRPNRLQWIPIALIVAVSALVYLPGLLQATIYRDDWYYVMDRLIGGAGIFPAMFSIDRPARGPFFEIYWQLFGINPLPYHLASYAWRLLSGLAAFWLFCLLWPGQRRAGMWMVVLFTLFPGYLRWMEGFEDQPRIASLCLEAISIALTLQAVAAAGSLPKIAAWLGSILAGWAYLALVDFGTGMELFRLLCVFVIVSRDVPTFSSVRGFLTAIRAWLPAALVPAGFLFWRFFIFHNERPQTDIGRQLGALLSSPLNTAATWLVRLVQSVADVSLFSWATPVLQGFFGLRLKEFILGAMAALFVLAALYLAVRLLESADVEAESASGGSWQMQAVVVGLLGVIAGVAPVVAANRYVDFERYSHYALPASLAAAMLITGILSLLRSRTTMTYVGAFLAACAVLAHYTYSVQVLDEERTISAFWQQVAWRVPALSPQTTLYVNYPGIDYVENVDAAQGPANFIYFRPATHQVPVTYAIAALPQSEQSVVDVLVGRSTTVRYRTHQSIVDVDRLLVLSQPAGTSCVHLLDGHSSLFSAMDPSQVRAIGAYSHAKQVLTTAKSPVLPPAIFGPELPHTWCYYFEKADLAMQSGDWQRIEELARQAAAAGLHADDAVEWMPFLEAYAHSGDAARFTDTAHRLAADPFVRRQACTVMRQKPGDTFSAAVQLQVDNLLCLGK